MADDAAIAQLLWQEEAHLFSYDDIEGATSSSADEGARPQKRRRPNNKPKAPRQGGQAKKPKPTQSSNTPSSKRAVQPGKPWDTAEETLFMEALELHGRDWQRCASHIGTRDARQISSHAQKHFIKLCLAGQALPARVVSSGGAGYTLSGKLLDPKSASAVAYGFKPQLLARLDAAGLERVKAGLVVAHLPRSLGGEADEELDTAPVRPSRGRGGHPPSSVLAPAGVGPASASAPPPSSVKPDAGASRTPRQPAAQLLPRAPLGALGATLVSGAEVGSAQEAAGASLASSSGDAGGSAPGSKPDAGAAGSGSQGGRPKRQGAGARMSTALLTATSESTQLMRPASFTGQPGSGAPLAQPFSMSMHAHVLVVCDCHAHLSECEVIGLLGGSWDPATRHLYVRAAYPCRRAAGSSARTSVEIDPCSQVEALTAMEEAGDHCVGWYHSHPVFEPIPSCKDLDNQHNYQALFRQPGSKVEPFVGLIVGPWHTCLPAPLSASHVFVAHTQAGSRQPFPFTVRYNLVSAHEVPGDEVTARMEGLFEEHASDAHRCDLLQEWRPSFAGSCTQTSAQSRGMSRLCKMQCSLAQYLCQVQDASQVLSWMCTLVTKLCQHWALPAPVTAAAVAPPEQHSAEPVIATDVQVKVELALDTAKQVRVEEPSALRAPDSAAAGL